MSLGKTRLTRVIGIKVTEAEYCMIKEAADKRGMYVSQYIMNLIHTAEKIPFRERYFKYEKPRT